MFIKKFIFMTLCAITFSTSAFAADEHAGAIYHAFRLETGVGSTNDGVGISNWHFDGWIGTDENKVWLKSEGKRENGVSHRAEFWTMYSRNIGTFWDAQIGVRHDTKPYSLTYGVIGFSGLAPYFFETKAHLFVSGDGDVSARIRQENEFLITQKLITQPYIEANLFLQDVPKLGMGAGLSSAEVGVQTRYEFTREFAMYFDVKYERKFGKTSSIVKNQGEDNDATAFTVGVKWMF
jgi:copper resistance protein B